jgi:hypothetical protein
VAKLTLELPLELQQLLQRRAARTRKEPRQVAIEILQKELAAEEKPRNERERVVEVLQRAGLLRPLSDELRKIADPAVTHEEVRAALCRAGGKPLSEIIIEQRQERHERFLS